MELQANLDVPKIWIDIKVTTCQGKVLQEYSEEGHSWVENFYRAICSAMNFGEVQSSLTIISNDNGGMVGRLSMYIGQNTDYGYAAKIGEGTGIRLGNSNQPFHVGDFTLFGAIGHGTGANQLYHQAQTRNYTFDYMNQTVKVTMSRVFNNNSGGSIIIREAGIFFKFNYIGRTSDPFVLMARDVLSVPITAPHGTLITVTYTLTSPSLRYLRPIPELGTKGMGGYYAGQIYNGGLYSHRKYGFIISPIAGEGTAACQASSVATGFTNIYTGIDNTQGYLGMGANSPMGVFCAAANAANLAGYNDWYIPSYMEMQILFPRVRDLLGPADVFTNTNYVSSTEYNSSRQDGGNPITSSWSDLLTKTTNYRVRLIRRILVDNFVAAV